MKSTKQQDNILTSISKLRMKLKSDKFELECIKNDFGKVRVSSINKTNNNVQPEKQNQQLRSNVAEKYDIIVMKKNTQINELINIHKTDIKSIVQKYQIMLKQQNELHFSQIQQMKASYQLLIEQKNVYIDMLKSTITLNKEQQINNNSIKQLKQYYQKEISKMKENYEQTISNLTESLKQKKQKETQKNYQQLNQSQISTHRLNFFDKDKTINRIQNSNFQADSDIFSSSATARESLLISVNCKPQYSSNIPKNNPNKKFSKLFKDKLKFKKQSTGDIGNIEIPSSHSSVLKQTFGLNKGIYKSSVNLCQQNLLKQIRQQNHMNFQIYKNQYESKK